MTIFIIGIFEMLISTAWTKAVSKSNVLASGGITVINILVWYYVLEKIIGDIQNIRLVVIYALGCAIGTMIGTYYLGSKRSKKVLKSDLETEGKFKTILW